MLSVDNEHSKLYKQVSLTSWNLWFLLFFLIYEPLSRYHGQSGLILKDNCLELHEELYKSSNIWDVFSNIWDISSNVWDIPSNIWDISSNIWNIALNIWDISSIIWDIASNSRDISWNVRDIPSNIWDISSNIWDISSNIWNVASNIWDISSNIWDILTNILDKVWSILMKSCITELKMDVFVSYTVLYKCVLFVIVDLELIHDCMYSHFSHNELLLNKSLYM